MFDCLLHSLNPRDAASLVMTMHSKHYIDQDGEGIAGMTAACTAGSGWQIVCMATECSIGRTAARTRDSTIT